MATRRPKVRYLREVWMKVIDPEKIQRARKRAGFTQYDLAALTRCTQATISALETGAMRGCSQDLAEALAKWLDRDVEDLFEAHPGSRMHRVTNAAGSKRQVAA
ncbi:helix-turn-helix transcriptional regulator [Cellulosimicrobium sp. ES-005]|uniref:Helix-turn-helix transcriptional regulator n=1 Tax=Cellulosimicrobium sp. ES-005 TaxID=3163031 RepID=A0AAU8FZV3_9MICO